MEQNKTGKYLKYAIGEIVLVVIGILIALSINNWNEGRKDRVREQAILAQLENEYSSNLIQLEAKMQMRFSVVSSGLTLLQYMNTPKLIPRDSAILHLGRINNDATFDPIQNDLISSGNIRLIQNQKLKSLLSNWSSDLMAVQEQEKMFSMMVHEIMRPLYNKLGISRDVYDKAWKSGGNDYWKLESSSDDKINIEFGNSLNSISSYEILTNKNLEGVVANTVNINTLGNQESIALKKRIDKILEQIKMELNK
ncbi:DUF6090 family protein [Flavobacteriaceae bacterium S0862]|nr:DUF6090 family protein [Flavobacteriaceae bacterium S0862]